MSLASKEPGDTISSMKLTLPDGLLRDAQITEEELRFDLALGLFIDDKATLGQAARLAGMSGPAFLDELGKRKLPVHYGIQDLEADIETIRELEDGKRG